jgi:sialic acid synthase SpsE
MHAVEGWPARPEQASLRRIGRLAAATRLPVGYSDHTAGVDGALLALAAGACVLEKDLGDARRCEPWALEPAAFAAMVARLREAEAMLGPREAGRPARRRYLCAASDLAAGTVLTRQELALGGPGAAPGALAPWEIERALGGRLLRALRAGEALAREDFEKAQDREPSWFGQKPPRTAPGAGSGQV